MNSSNNDPRATTGRTRTVWQSRWLRLLLLAIGLGYALCEIWWIAVRLLRSLRNR